MKFSQSILFFSALAALSVSSVTVAKDGTYTATTLGRNGDVTVQVTISNNKIENVKVLNWSETHPVADLPKIKALRA